MNCELCGKPFIPKTKVNKYCSWDCRYEAYKERSRQNNKLWRARRRVYPIEAVCVSCGDKFKKLKPSHLTCGSEECMSMRRRNYYRDLREGKRKITKRYNWTYRKSSLD